MQALYSFTLASALLLTPLAAKTDMLMPLSTNVSPDGKHIAFSWKNDIWKVSVKGGEAERITTHPAADYRPIFSPDGKSLYFNSNREGPMQVFLKKLGNGRAKQITKHTETTILEDVSRDGKSLLTRCLRDFTGRNPMRLYSVDLEKPAGEKLLFNTYATGGKVSPDGNKVIFTREGVESYRKQYKGTQAGQIWIYDKTTNKFSQPVSSEYGVRWPIWSKNGKSFYYVSQKDKTFNLYRHDLKSGKNTQLTKFKDDGVILPAISADGSTIVFRRLFHLYTLSTKKGSKPRKIEIHTHEIDHEDPVRKSIASKTTDADFSKSGLEIAMTANNDLYVMDTVLREPVQITDTLAVEKNIIFSQDNKAIYYIKDDGIKTSICKVTKKDDKTFWWRTTEFIHTTILESEHTLSHFNMSPDGKKFAVANLHGDMIVVDIDGKNKKIITTGWSTVYANFSPDSKWLTYSQQNDNFNSDIFIAKADGSEKPFNLSQHPDNEFSPVWSKDGKSIAFMGRRYGTTYDIFIAELYQKEKSSRSTKIESAEKAMAKDPNYKKEAPKVKDPKSKDPKSKDPKSKDPKSKDPKSTDPKSTDPKSTDPKSTDPKSTEPKPTEPKPTEPKPTEPKPTEPKPTEPKPTEPKPTEPKPTEPKPTEPKPTEPKPTEPKPTEPKPTEPKPTEPKPTEPKPTEPKPTEPKPTELKPTEPRSELLDVFTSDEDKAFQLDGITKRFKRLKVKGDIRSIEWSHDSKKLLIQSRGGKTISAITIKDGKVAKFADASGSILRVEKSGKIFMVNNGIPAVISGGRATNYTFKIYTELNKEDHFRRAFRLAWRTMGDGFYDASLNNRDWNAVLKKYEDAAAASTDSDAFDRIVSKMLGELNASHTGFSPMPWSKGYKPSPLREAVVHLGLLYDSKHKGEGYKIKSVLEGGPADKEYSKLEVGEVILAIEGKKIQSDTPLAEALYHKIGKEIKLKVKNLKGKERTVNIAPTSYKGARVLITQTEVETNERAVSKLSNNKLGYIHISRMMWDEFEKFERHIFEKGYGKDGIIIDVRDNGGGFTTDHLLTVLNQKRHAFTIPRNGGEGYPQDRIVYATWDKPITVLCNQNSFSNAEIFSHAIKTLGRGKLVGVQTAGGVISTGSKSIPGAGTLRYPFRGWFDLEGNDMEMHGAMPNITIWPTPADQSKGIDKQLEKAVEVLTKEVKTAKPLNKKAKYKSTL